MKVSFKRIDKKIALPSLSVKDSVKINLLCRKDTIVNPRGNQLVPANVKMKLPKGYLGIVILPENLRRKGLMIQRGAMILDSGDYLDDELCISIYNLTDERAIIMSGEVMAQVAFLKAEKATIQEEK